MQELRLQRRRLPPLGFRRRLHAGAEVTSQSGAPLANELALQAGVRPVAEVLDNGDGLWLLRDPLIAQNSNLPAQGAEARQAGDRGRCGAQAADAERVFELAAGSQRGGGRGGRRRVRELCEARRGSVVPGRSAGVAGGLPD